MIGAIVKIGKWIPGKFDDTKIQQVIFKGIDDNKEYFLNQNTKYPQRVEHWAPVIKEGNVLEFDLQDNGKNINYFNSYKIIKTV